MALLNLDSIDDAAVVARTDPRGNQRLVAYCIEGQQPAPTETTLLGSLTKSLPDYMIPSEFVCIDAFPQAPSGKLNRRALLAYGNGRPELEPPFTPPETPVEEIMAEVWTAVLGLDRVGINDNFLELGGDSLLASQVISRVISAFRVELPLRSLFEAPTVADMAVAIVQNQAKQVEQGDVERMLAELEALSDEEAERLLAEESAGV